MYLLIRHSIALVLGFQQHGKHISHVLPFCTMLMDQRVDKVINRARTSLSSPILREGKATLQFSQLGIAPLGIVDYIIKCVAQRGSLRWRIDVE